MAKRETPRQGFRWSMPTSAIYSGATARPSDPLLKEEGRGGEGSYEEIGPEGQAPGFPLAGGVGAQTAATASRGSLERMRGRS